MNYQPLGRWQESCGEEAALEMLKNVLQIEGTQPELGNVGTQNSPTPNPPIPAGAEFIPTTDSGDDIFVLYDRDLRYVWVNPAGAAQLGVTLEAVRGKTNRELFGQKAAEIEDLLEKVLQTGEKITVDRKLPLPEGLKIYRSACKPVKDSSGRVSGVVAVYREIRKFGELQPSAEKAIARERFRAEQYKALSGVVARIRKSLDLEAIFKATATEVRQLIQADRVAVFRFYPEHNWEGEIISEDVLPGWVSALHAKIRDHCFGDRYAPYYQQGRIAAVDNIYAAGLSDCYLEMLSKLQVFANLVAPLRAGDRLWGLLCIHQCSNSRRWEPEEMEFVTQIADHLGVAIQHAEYLEQVTAQSEQLKRAAEREKAISATVEKIRRSLDINEIFATTTREVRLLLTCDRVAVYRFSPDFSGEFVAESFASGWAPLVGNLPVICDSHLQATRGGRYANGKTLAVDDIYQAGHSDCHVKLLEQFQAKAYIAVPIWQGEKLWGLLAAYQNSQPRHWEAHEVDLLAQIGGQFGVALQQAEYLEQVKAQAAQLEKAAEWERAVTATVDKIRRSLDIDEIFSTTTREVRRLLECDRVGVYRFYPDWSGEFIAESFATGWNPFVSKLPVIADTHLQETQGGRYARGESLAVDDIYKAGHADCHIQLLEQLQAKAYIIVPILQGEKLWGLLAAYQNSRSRHWEEYEVKMVAQIGVQMGVALQQAELLAQTRRQAEELAETLRDLQQTQTQLIQSEKMASLGQLVAGVAHEINNPVNFIHGNLSHVSDYIRDLMELVELYQQQCPPNPAIQALQDEIDLEFLIEDLPRVLSSMKVGTERIRQLVLSLRNFSRLDEAESKLADIHDGLDSTLLILQHRLKARTDRLGIQVVKEYGQLPLVECYPAQLNQVFMNLLSNAIDALEEANGSGLGENGKNDPSALPDAPCPTIWIRTEVIEGDSLRDKSASRAVIRIADNGPGMPPAVRDRIFDPFFTTKPIGKGTGLGLSISYQIVVEKHGGVIQCISRSGEGTEFRIEIPIRADRGALSAIPKAAG